MNDWTFATHIIDPGGYDRESVHSVTVNHNGRSYATEYRMGCGLRKWKRTFYHGGGYWDKYRKPGQRVGMLPRLKQPKDCECKDHQQAIFDEFNQLTEPETPTLKDVLSCLLLDASSVRHGQTFDEFANEFGYDTDSRKAEGIYRACIETWQGLTRLGADFDKLEEEFKDY